MVQEAAQYKTDLRDKETLRLAFEASLLRDAKIAMYWRAKTLAEQDQKREEGARKFATHMASLREAKNLKKLSSRCKTEGCSNTRPSNDRGGKRTHVVESGFCTSCYNRKRKQALYLHATICDDVIRYVLLDML
jgi:hypothetical protein